MAVPAGVFCFDVDVWVLFVEFLQRLEGDLMAAVAPHQDIRRSTSCASEEKALRPRVAERVALISTFFIVMLQGSQREVLFGFGVKDVTLVEIKGEIDFAIQSLGNHRLRIVRRHAGGQLIISNPEINKEFMSMFSTRTISPAQELSANGSSERDKLRAHAKEHLLILMGFNFALQPIVERQPLIAQRQMQATTVLNQLAGTNIHLRRADKPGDNIFFGWW